MQSSLRDTTSDKRNVNPFGAEPLEVHVAIALGKSFVDLGIAEGLALTSPRKGRYPEVTWT